MPHSNYFVNMWLCLFDTDEAGARRMLTLVGWIDLALPLLALVPRTRAVAMGYAGFWGLATALTRILCYYTPAEAYYGMHPWLAECVVRATHGLVPLAMLLLAVQLQRSSSRAPRG